VCSCCPSECAIPVGCDETTGAELNVCVAFRAADECWHSHTVRRGSMPASKFEPQSSPQNRRGGFTYSITGNLRWSDPRLEVEHHLAPHSWTRFCLQAQNVSMRKVPVDALLRHFVSWRDVRCRWSLSPRDAGHRIFCSGPRSGTGAPPQIAASQDDCAGD
jgi:hypothetical protein